MSAEPARPPPDPRGQRLGPFWLAPGVTRTNGLVLFYTTFSTICLVSWISFANPYLFAVLEVPADRQGSLSSLLVFLQETVQILFGTLIGAFSDRHGRRVVYVTGLVLMAAGFVAYPLATSEGELVALRTFYAVGMTSATVMMSTSLAEYTQDATRGRWMGTGGVCNGLGVVLMATVLAKLPNWLVGQGYSQVEALRLSFWIFAVYLLALATLARFGLAAPQPRAVHHRTSLLRQTVSGLAIAKENPRIALAYVTGFASRGDLVILTTFVSLWVVQAGIAEGMTPAEATGRAGMVFGIAQSVALCWSVIMGFILDRIPRLTGIVIAYGLAAAGYAALGLVDDPLSSGMIPAAMFAGVGEASAVVAAGVLIGQEAPAANRGVVLGTFGVCGAIGMLVLTLGGGQVYDSIGGGAPFLMMGIVNGIVALWALAVRRHVLRAVADPAAS